MQKRNGKKRLVRIWLPAALLLLLVGSKFFQAASIEQRLRPKNSALEKSLSNVTHVRVERYYPALSAVLQGNAARELATAFELDESSGGHQLCTDAGSYDLKFYEGKKQILSFSYSISRNELRSDAGFWEREAKLTSHSKTQVDKILGRVGF